MDLLAVAEITLIRVFVFDVVIVASSDDRQFGKHLIGTIRPWSPFDTVTIVDTMEEPYRCMAHFMDESATQTIRTGYNFRAQFNASRSATSERQRDFQLIFKSIHFGSQNSILTWYCCGNGRQSLTVSCSTWSVCSVFHRILFHCTICRGSRSIPLCWRWNSFDIWPHLDDTAASTLWLQDKWRAIIHRFEDCVYICKWNSPSSDLRKLYVVSFVAENGSSLGV